MTNVQGLYQLPRRRRIASQLWRPLLVGVVGLLVAQVSATQYLAHQFGDTAELGHELLRTSKLVIYEPWAWVPWEWQWSFRAQGAAAAAFKTTSLIVVGGSAAAVILAILYRYSMLLGHGRGLDTIHGSAHWATRRDMVAAGLLYARTLFRRSHERSYSIYVGAWLDPSNRRVYYLKHRGPEHVAVIAPTRSGKGVGVVIPNAVSWEGSLLAYDIKGELWELTAGHRAKTGQRCIRFEPGAISNTGRFNPLAEIRVATPYEFADTQNIVTILVDPNGVPATGVEEHFRDQAADLLTCAILHCLYVTRLNGLPPPSLTDVSRLLSDPVRPITETLEAMLGAPHDPTGALCWTLKLTDVTRAAGMAVTEVPTITHPKVAELARSMLNKDGREFSGIVSTARRFLQVYSDPLVEGNTCVSDFKISDIVDADAPMSLYLVVSPADQDRLRPFIRLLLNLILRRLTAELKFVQGRGVSPHKHKLLALIDEFPQLGKLNVFAESMAFMAGYGIRALLIAQDISQINEKYGRDNSILANCHLRVFYAPNTIDTAKTISAMIGETTVVASKVTWHGITGFGRRQINETLQENKRPLLNPDEVMRIRAPEKDSGDRITSAGDIVVMVAGFAPVYGRQLLYFQDPTFLERCTVRAPRMERPARAVGSIRA
jgi:type IV secretion system protein VirD4